MSPRPLLAGLALATLLLPTAASAGRRPLGQSLTLSGQVTDPEGTPVAGLTVMLEMSRERFRLSRWGRERQGLLQLPTVTAADGTFSLDWSWDPYYNRYELVVAQPIREAGKESFKIFFRRPLTELLKSTEGASLDLPGLVLEDIVYLEWLRDFLAGLASPTQARTYEQLGLPEQVDTDAHTGNTSWWYFTLGRVYRFRDGDLAEVQEFEPIPDP